MEQFLDSDQTNNIGQDEKNKFLIGWLALAKENESVAASVTAYMMSLQQAHNQAAVVETNLKQMHARDLAEKDAKYEVLRLERTVTVEDKVDFIKAAALLFTQNFGKSADIQKARANFYAAYAKMYKKFKATKVSEEFYIEMKALAMKQLGERLKDVTWPTHKAMMNQVRKMCASADPEEDAIQALLRQAINAQQG